jgi:hypothetical protein
MQTTKRIIGSAAVLAVLLTDAACGDGGANAAANKVASLSGNTATTRASGSKGNKKSFQDAMLAYAKCMREHGVDMPDPTFSDDGGGGVGFIAKADGSGTGAPQKPDDSVFKAAQTACEPIMKAAEQDMPRPSAEEEAKMRDQALKFAKCMRDHGVDMPDPTFDNEGHTQIKIGPSAGNGPATAAGGPSGAMKVDPAFEAAMKACNKDAPIKSTMSGGKV